MLRQTTELGVRYVARFFVRPIVNIAYSIKLADMKGQKACCVRASDVKRGKQINLKSCN